MTKEISSPIWTPYVLDPDLFLAAGAFCRLPNTVDARQRACMHILVLDAHNVSNALIYLESIV